MGSAVARISVTMMPECPELVKQGTWMSIYMIDGVLQCNRESGEVTLDPWSLTPAEEVAELVRILPGVQSARVEDSFRAAKAQAAPASSAPNELAQILEHD